jgi:hypothetical protein
VGLVAIATLECFIGISLLANRWMVWGSAPSGLVRPNPRYVSRSATRCVTRASGWGC